MLGALQKKQAQHSPSPAPSPDPLPCPQVLGLFASKHPRHWWQQCSVCCRTTGGRQELLLWVDWAAKVLPIRDQSVKMVTSFLSYPPMIGRIHVFIWDVKPRGTTWLCWSRVASPACPCHLWSRWGLRVLWRGGGGGFCWGSGTIFPARLR